LSIEKLLAIQVIKLRTADQPEINAHVSQSAPMAVSSVMYRVLAYNVRGVRHFV
jgi:hypothetical protein